MFTLQACKGWEAQSTTMERSGRNRNEVLHMDFLSMGETYNSTRYLLVLKDELTHFCELIACDSACSEMAAAVVLDWAKRFGLPAAWMSDQCSHFKNQVLEELSRRWKLDTKNWEYVLPVVQHNLNNSPVSSLANKAPVELFTGLPTTTQLDVLLQPGQSAAASRLKTVDMGHGGPPLEKLRKSFHEMHGLVKDRKERQRFYQIAAIKDHQCNFTVRDYVLWLRVDEQLNDNKLMVRWVGPFRIVEVLSHSIVIDHQLTGHHHDVHGTRLKFYEDSRLDVTEEVLDHFSHQGILLVVAEQLEHRFNTTTKPWEVLVSWQGLQAFENSW
ncbi:LOW QUALITY PROTEIN: Hypothetical protein PHPALM_17005 [Phytophthora palmivora]|uniref:Integrase catalytic domain-containing protein n=1 Tax=Phytophthora palmivora TaxID=4796 RepID=A0A2P4XNC2_9STRA|nr:LOW QUALITY PROTEIN: Hypothetical protein PHPALM_17005 [Phytophthora palmivora]